MMIKFLHILLLALSLCSANAVANKHQDNLKNVQQAITEAQENLKEKQKAQQNTQNVLKKTNQALQHTQKELNQLNHNRKQIVARLNELQTQLEQLQTGINQAKTQTARLLNAHYQNRRANALMLFLKNAEHSQKARYLEYAKRINQANQVVVKKLSDQQKEIKQYEQQIQEELDKLSKLKNAQQKKLKELGASNRHIQAEHEQLNQEIKDNNRRLAQLRQDEKRLNQILANIAKKQANKRKPVKPQANKKTQKAQQGKPNNQGSNARQEEAVSSLTAEDLALTAPYETSNTFSLQQGRMNAPVKGAVIGRYGEARPNGGVWKGLFYRSSASSVRNIADGTVAYAGYIGGYGHTVIVDHGSGYTSIYASLSSISVSNGVEVEKGTQLGVSGVHNDAGAGLYFEIRYRHGTLNPASWVR